MANPSVLPSLRGRTKLLIAALLLAGMAIAALSLRSPNPAAAQAGGPYSVIVLSADGMGPSQRIASQLYHYGLDKTQPMDSLPYGGNLRTNSITAVTDSSASATSMGTGQITKNGYVGVDVNGKRLTNLVEVAHSMGKSAGLVEDHDVTNATMGGFAAHVDNRDHKAMIARQYLEQTKPEVIFGGGEKIWYPEGNPGKIPDVLDDDASNNKVNLVKQAKGLGYQYAWDQKSLNAMTGPKALALVQDDAYIRGHEIKGYKKGQDPNFVPQEKLVEKALEILGQDPEGFFMAIDVDELDDGGHEHDGRTVIQMGGVVNRIVQTIQAYRAEHPNVLVIVTADHETGGMQVEHPSSKATNSGPDGNVPDYGTPQNVPLPNGATPKLWGPFPVKGSDGQKFKVDWTTPAHTGTMVPVTAAGPGAERLTGVHHNSFIFELASDVMAGNLNP